MSCENHKPLQQLQRGTFTIALSAAKGTKKVCFIYFVLKYEIVHNVEYYTQSKEGHSCRG